MFALDAGWPVAHPPVPKVLRNTMQQNNNNIAFSIFGIVGGGWILDDPHEVCGDL